MEYLLSFINLSNVHMNILFLLGIALFGGTIGGRLFQHFKIPQVVSYIVIGIILGESFINFINKEVVNAFEPFSYFALGLIGFMIGGELEFRHFKKSGKQFLYILLFEAITPFFIVFILISTVSFLLTGNFTNSIVFGLLLGSISAATAAAGTTDVLWEYKAKGPLTTTLLGIIALDDILALFLFAISSSISESLITKKNSLLIEIALPVYEISVAILIGVVSGFLLARFLKRSPDEEKSLTFSIGGILLVLGLALILKVDMILASMFMGIIITNIAHFKSKHIFKLLEKFAPPIYILFFVLVGAKLNLSKLNVFILIFIVVYLVGRTLGKMIGANFGAKLSKAPKTIQKFLSFCLFSQSGVALGLSILASQKFPDSIGNMIILVITSSTFVVQIIGPLFTKYAIHKSGEAGLNITEEDIIKKMKVTDIIDQNFPKLYPNSTLKDIIGLFGQYENLYFPVITENNKIIGIISVDRIKEMLQISGVDDLLVAYDLMDSITVKAKIDSTLPEINDLLKKSPLDCIPIIDDSEMLISVIESRHIKKAVANKMFELENNLMTL
ncbi:MAG: hypothetical protein A2Y34_01055, partial [Spirochaetes bacterium GWC1_27_15]